MSANGTEVKLDTSVAPAWFPDEDSKERVLWTTSGYWDVDPPKRGPYRLMTSEEEAIRWARENKVGYTWDGCSPFRSDVKTQLIQARQIGRPGVCVMSYIDHQWVVLEHYSV